MERKSNKLHPALVAKSYNSWYPDSSPTDISPQEISSVDSSPNDIFVNGHFSSGQFPESHILFQE